jgi:hypothetical protein
LISSWGLKDDRIGLYFRSPASGEDRLGLNSQFSSIIRKALSSQPWGAAITKKWKYYSRAACLSALETSRYSRVKLVRVVNFPLISTFSLWWKSRISSSSWTLDDIRADWHQRPECDFARQSQCSIFDLNTFASVRLAIDSWRLISVGIVEPNSNSSATRNLKSLIEELAWYRRTNRP